MSTLVFLQNYNNYYNRVIKRSDSYSDYLSNYNYIINNNVNFVPNDNVTTTQVINWNESWKPDYVLVFNNSTFAGTGTETIQSRWFIVDFTRLRQKQYQLTLRRDIISDDFSALGNSVFSITRCMLNPENDLIFNKEQFSYSQVKQGDYSLYDNTRCAWIVGYLTNSALSATSGTFSNTSSEYDISMSSVHKDNWINNQYLGIKTGVPEFVTAKVGIAADRAWWIGGREGGYLSVNPQRNTYNRAGSIGVVDIGIKYNSIDSLNAVINTHNLYNSMNWTTVQNLVATNYAGQLTAAKIEELAGYDGKKILFSNGIYEASFSQTTSEYVDVSMTEDVITTEITNQIASLTTGVSANNHVALYTYKKTNYYFKLTKVANATSYTWTLPSSMQKLIDAPYRMFCMPLVIDSELYSVAFQRDTTPYFMSSSLVTKVMNNIIETLNTGAVENAELFDVQILPYCPMVFSSYVTDTYETQQGIQWETTTCHMTNMTNGLDFSNITASDGETTSTVGYIFFPKQASFSKTLTTVQKKQEFSVRQMKDVFKITDTKIQSETEFIRLCAGNHSAAFDMVPAKNNGLESITARCTYKPYNPFIQLSPRFERLYGDSYIDSRGLVCAGDYSVAIINNAWQQYELNNKNYQQAFNREVEHLGVYQKQERIQGAVSTVTGALTGAAGGALVGSRVPLIGTAAGAAAGAGASMIAGAVDLALMGERQKEDISYKKDIFNFSLDNIQALPNSLYKTSAIVANSRYVPFIEFYSATDQEKAILAEYITYNGMTAGYVGPITTTGFVQGNIIRFNGNLEAQEIDAFNEELLKGVYLQ